MLFHIFLTISFCLSFATHVNVRDEECLWPPNGKHASFVGLLQTDAYVTAVSPSCSIQSRILLNCTYIDVEEKEKQQQQQQQLTNSEEDKRNKEEDRTCIFDGTGDTLCVSSKRLGSAKGGRIYSVWLRAYVNCTSEPQDVAWLVKVPHDARGQSKECLKPGSGACVNVTKPNPPPAPPQDYRLTLELMAEIYESKKSVLVDVSNEAFIDNDMLVNVISLGDTLQNQEDFRYHITLDKSLNSEPQAEQVFVDSQVQIFQISQSRFAILPSSKRVQGQTYVVSIKVDPPGGMTQGEVAGLIVGLVILSTIIMVGGTILYKRSRYRQYTSINEK